LAIGRCAFLLSAAGAVGAFFDERHHVGVSSWLALCQSRPVPLFVAVTLQMQLLPTMLIAMGATAVAQLAWVVLRANRRRLFVVAAGHAGCVAGMLMSILLCSRILVPGTGTGWNVLAMLALDILVCLAFAPAAAVICQKAGRHRVRGSTTGDHDPQRA
jgi:hypothetical protein